MTETDALKSHLKPDEILKRIEKIRDHYFEAYKNAANPDPTVREARKEALQCFVGDLNDFLFDITHKCRECGKVDCEHFGFTCRVCHKVRAYHTTRMWNNCQHEDWESYREDFLS